MELPIGTNFHAALARLSGFSPPTPSPTSSPPSKKRRLFETECAEVEEEEDDEFTTALKMELENQQPSPSKPPSPKKRRPTKPRKNPHATLFAGNKRNIQRASTPSPPPDSPPHCPLPASPLHLPPPKLPLPRGWDYRHVLRFRHQLVNIFTERETSQLTGMELREAMAQHVDDDILEQVHSDEATAGLFSRLLEVNGEKVLLRELKEVKRRMAMEDWDEFAEVEDQDCVVTGAKRKETEVIVVD